LLTRKNRRNARTVAVVSDPNGDVRDSRASDVKKRTRLNGQDGVYLKFSFCQRILLLANLAQLKRCKDKWVERRTPANQMRAKIIWLPWDLSTPSGHHTMSQIFETLDVLARCKVP
jgi:hypothetical protein